MTKYSHTNKLPGLFLVAGFILILSLLWFSPTQANESQQQTEEYCLSCHSNPDLKMTLPSGEVLPLYILIIHVQASPLVFNPFTAELSEVRTAGR